VDPPDVASNYPDQDPVGKNTSGTPLLGLGRDDFRISGLQLGLGPGEKGLGLGLTTIVIVITQCQKNRWPITMYVTLIHL